MCFGPTPCSVDTTLYWSSSCVYSSNTRPAGCGVAYLDAALTQPTMPTDSTACGWHWGLVSSICGSASGIGTSHIGDHVFVGTIGTSVHAYDGRPQENPNLRFWVR